MRKKTSKKIQETPRGEKERRRGTRREEPVTTKRRKGPRPKQAIR